MLASGETSLKLTINSPVAKRITNIPESLRRYPPGVVRIMAKHRIGPFHSRAYSDAEVAIKANMPVARVRAISRLPDWEEVTHAEFDVFCQGCGFNPTRVADRERYTNYLLKCQKRSVIPFQYLRASPLWEVEFRPLLMLTHVRSALIHSTPTPPRTSACAS